MGGAAAVRLRRRDAAPDQRSLGLVQVDEIYLTHFHADHILGLPGLLKTYDLTDREVPLTIYGPPGLRELFAILSRSSGGIGFELELVELAPGEAVAHDGTRCGPSRPPTARAPTATRWSRTSGPGASTSGRQAPGVPEGPAFAALQRGEEVEGTEGTVPPEQVIGPGRPGRTVAITGDTAPSPATVAAAADADLLIHDASFAEEEAQRAAETGHSTVGQAAAVADEAHVKLLALVHISSRYHVGNVLEEAREVFEPTVAPRDFDLIEIPFPERGNPELVPNGARERGAQVGPQRMQS